MRKTEDRVIVRWLPKGRNNEKGPPVNIDLENTSAKFDDLEKGMWITMRPESQVRNATPVERQSSGATPEETPLSESARGNQEVSQRCKGEIVDIDKSSNHVVVRWNESKQKTQGSPVMPKCTKESKSWWDSEEGGKPASDEKEELESWWNGKAQPTCEGGSVYTTPLHMATEEGNTVVVEIMLRDQLGPKGEYLGRANPSFRDGNGRTPLDIAIDSGDTGTAGVIRDTLMRDAGKLPECESNSWCRSTTGEVDGEDSHHDLMREQKALQEKVDALEAQRKADEAKRVKEDAKRAEKERAEEAKRAEEQRLADEA